MNFPIKKHTILCVVAGSRAYNMHTSESDIDLLGVAIPPKDYFLGTIGRFEQANKPSHLAPFQDLLTEEEKEVVKNTKLEGTIYGIRKFIKLASDCNPNIMDLLFCRLQEVRYKSPVGLSLRRNRNKFLSQKAKHTYGGYAQAALKRMEAHREWIINPPKSPPDPKDFDVKILSSKQLRNTENLLEIPLASNWESEALNKGFDANLISILQEEKRFLLAKKRWKQYLNWKNQQSKHRARIDESCGYDSKHGAHLIRLLRMGCEVWETGELQVWREDAEELKAIRRGEWSYDRLMSEANTLKQRLKEGTETPLPKKVDGKAINELTISLIERFLFK